MQPIIPFNDLNQWVCVVCGKQIHPIVVEGKTRKDDRLEPESKYWNTEREEPFCSAAHSLQRHEELSHK